jgi:hypothetical protein
VVLAKLPKAPVRKRAAFDLHVEHPTDAVLILCAHALVARITGGQDFEVRPHGVGPAPPLAVVVEMRFVDRPLSVAPLLEGRAPCVPYGLSVGARTVRARVAREPDDPSGRRLPAHRAVSVRSPCRGLAVSSLLRRHAGGKG